MGEVKYDNSLFWGIGLLVGAGFIFSVYVGLKVEEKSREKNYLSKLEKQVINITPSNNTEKILHDEKTGINYQVKYDSTGNLNLVPYEGEE